MNLKEGQVEIGQAQYTAICQTLDRLIGPEAVDQMHDIQWNHLSNGLHDLIVKYDGDVDKIPDAEIVGAYEMIVDHAVPLSFLQLLGV